MNDSDDLILNTTLHAIDAAMPVERPRAHLGMSQIGKTDERTLWLKFRWSLPDEPTPRVRRIFSLGNAIETEIINLLSRIPGVELYDRDPETGEQFRFALCGGHFGGSMDFVIRGVPEAPKTWHVGECKSVNGKRFADLQKKGVKEWSPEYYGQLQAYMRNAKLERALFVAYCKDNSELYTERVRLDKMFADSLFAKAERIITASEPPASTWPNENWYESKFLSDEVRAVYWGGRLPPKAHCRNCRFSRPLLSYGDGTDTPPATWACNMTESFPDYEHQLKGCGHHNWIPALVPARLTALHNDCAQYTTHDGVEFFNIPAGQNAFHQQAYSSQELSALTVGGLTRERLEDPNLQAIRTVFDSTIIDANLLSNGDST